MQLGENDLKRLRIGLKRGCSGDCFKSHWLGPQRGTSYCPDWLCDKIIPPRLRNKVSDAGLSPCPCTHMKWPDIEERVLRMLMTGRTID